MATNVEQIKQDMVDQLRGQVEVKTKKLDEKALKKEGTESIDDLVESITSDMMVNTFQQQMSSANFMPTILDPQIYDNGVLYGMTPCLTYLESKGRRMPANSTEIEYIKLTAGFAGEWVQETDATSGSGEATTSTATANMKYLALPISLSDMIGKGASATARAQLMEYAQMALREEFNRTLVAGDVNVNYEFDGLDEIAEDSGTRVNMSGAEITIDDLNSAEATMTRTPKTFPTFLLTGAEVLNQIKADMMATLRNVDKVDVTAGVRVPAFASNRGDVPIIADPNVPATAAARRLDFINELFVFISDFVTPSFVAKGKSKPFASDGWLTQVAVLYHTAPAKNVQLYGIA